MTAYQVSKFCRDCLRNAQLRELARRDPAEALEGYDLTPAERAALLAGDVGALYEAGASAFLLSYLTRWQLFGLDVPTYADRMRAASRG
jgi:Aromatic-ring-opening dioxygenase LigAB, LigA subunit